MMQSSPNVLVVEGDTQLADLFGELIPDAFSTEVVYRAGKAFDRLDPSLDILVLDREVGDQPGRDVSAHRQAMNIDCQVVIVSVFAESTADTIDYDAYLEKPVSGAELAKTLNIVTETGSDDRPPRPKDPDV